MTAPQQYCGVRPSEYTISGFRCYKPRGTKRIVPARVHKKSYPASPALQAHSRTTGTPKGSSRGPYWPRSGCVFCGPSSRGTRVRAGGVTWALWGGKGSPCLVGKCWFAYYGWGGGEGPQLWFAWASPAATGP